MDQANRRPPTDSYQTAFDLSSREPDRPALGGALEATDHRNWAMTAGDQVAAATAAAAIWLALTPKMSATSAGCRTFSPPTYPPATTG